MIKFNGYGAGTGNFFQSCMPVKNGVEFLNPPPSLHLYLFNSGVDFYVKDA